MNALHCVADGFARAFGLELCVTLRLHARGRGPETPAEPVTSWERSARLAHSPSLQEPAAARFRQDGLRCVQKRKGVFRQVPHD